jgi:hypothetical protein
MSASPTAVRQLVTVRERVGAAQSSRDASPSRRLQVIVTVESALPHRAIELIDTPCVGSVLAHNTAEADIAMQSMDVAVLVLAAW